jgi:hypothetical protein
MIGKAEEILQERKNYPNSEASWYPNGLDPLNRQNVIIKRGFTKIDFET